MVPEGAAARAYIPLNPVVTRGQDSELWWLGKYPGDQEIAGLLDNLCRSKDAETREKAQRLRGLIKSAGEAERPALEVDIRNLYRTEHIAPERLIERLYRIRDEGPQSRQLAFNELLSSQDRSQTPARHRPLHRRDPAIILRAAGPGGTRRGRGAGSGPAPLRGPGLRPPAIGRGEERAQGRERGLSPHRSVSPSRRAPRSWRSTRATPMTRSRSTRSVRAGRPCGW